MGVEADPCFLLIGMSHAREAKMLCRKTVNFFSLLSHTQDPPEHRASITQELLALVTGLAHYLKILIRIALTGSLKLEREHGNTKALDYLLSRLSLLAMDDADPLTSVRGQGRSRHTGAAEVAVPPGFTPSTRGIAYGYRSLAVSVPYYRLLSVDLTRISWNSLKSPANPC